MRAPKHELHAAEISKCCPALLDGRPIENLEAVGIWDRTQPCDRTFRFGDRWSYVHRGLFDFMPRELSGAFDKLGIGFCHNMTIVLSTIRARPPKHCRARHGDDLRITCIIKPKRDRLYFPGALNDGDEIEAARWPWQSGTAALCQITRQISALRSSARTCAILGFR